MLFDLDAETQIQTIRGNLIACPLTEDDERTDLTAVIAGTLP